MSHSSKLHNGLAHRSTAEGFTLVELMISIAIIGFITSVVLLSQSGYTDVAALRNSADDIALTISQSQTYGLGVREVSTGSNDFSAAYGTVFNIVNGADNAFILFADRNGNEMYDSAWACPQGEECVEKINITNGNIITDVCELKTTGGESCSFGRVDVSFKRPNPEGVFVFFDLNGVKQNLPDILGARIRLQSPGGKTKSVRIYKTGQVSVQ